MPSNPISHQLSPRECFYLLVSLIFSMYNGLCDVMCVPFAKTCRTMNEAKRSDIRTKVLVKDGMRV